MWCSSDPGPVQTMKSSFTLEGARSGEQLEEQTAER
jgi:hypothetical protein